MASSSVVIALAGGGGAAIGAGVGQFVQWWRESVRTKVEDRRRAEDRRDAAGRERRAYQQAAYAAAVGECLQMKRRVQQSIAGLYRSGLMGHSADDLRTTVIAQWDELGQDLSVPSDALTTTMTQYGTLPLLQLADRVSKAFGSLDSTEFEALWLRQMSVYSLDLQEKSDWDGLRQAYVLHLQDVLALLGELVDGIRTELGVHGDASQP